MHDKVNKFLDSVCRNIKYKPAHKDIRDELEHHVNELKQELVKETQDEETALDMAILAMGDCDEIGKQLNKKHRHETEWSLVGLTFILAVIGGIVMYSSSRFETYQAVDFKRYLVFAVIGVAVMIGLYFFDYTKLRKFAWPLYLLSLVLIIAASVNDGRVNGMQSYISIVPRNSTEIATFLFIISFASILENSRGKGAIFSLSALAFISVIPFIMLPRISQTLLLLTVYSVLIVIAISRGHFNSSKLRQFIFLGSIVGLFGFLFYRSFFSGTYRMDRLINYLANYATRGQADPNGFGYTQVVADKLLGASKLFGAADAKISGYEIDTVMPGVTTNYVLINVFATFGWIVGVALIVIIAVYIGRLFITTGKIKNRYGFYLSLSLCTVLSAQFVTGILMNLNLFPPTSVYIPFVSYGGAEYIISMASIGLILSVWRKNNVISEKPRSTINSTTDFIKIDDGKIIINLNNFRRLWE